MCLLQLISYAELIMVIEKERPLPPTSPPCMLVGQEPDPFDNL